MALNDFDYRVHSLSAAQPGWFSIGLNDTTSTGEISMFAVPVAAWGVATYDVEDKPFDQVVGLVPDDGGIEPLEVWGHHLGYAGPGQDWEKIYRDDAIRAVKSAVERKKRRAAKHGAAR